MQKWLPDDFASDFTTGTAVALEDPAVFKSDISDSHDIQDENQRLFKSESGFTGPEAIMGHLTREERAQLFELVEQDINAEYAIREKELVAKLDADLAQAGKNFDDAMAQWSGKLHQAMAMHMKETADASARLAVQLAEKIVRKNIELDNEILVRGIQTALFKIENTKSLTININPDQAAWLENLPEVMEKLGVQQINADRRIEAGGCLIKTEKQEWDVTVSGQLNYLSELVEEMITTADLPELTGEDGTDAEPILE